MREETRKTARVQAGDEALETVNEKTLMDQLDELEENIYLSDFHSSKGNSEQVVELDNKFHEILYDASGSYL